MTYWTATITRAEGSEAIVLEAGTARQAIREVLRRTAGTPMLALEVRPSDLAPVGTFDLVSNVEVARILGVTRQRAQQLDVNPPPGYPAAVARTAAGALRFRADVEAFAARPRSRGGRPRR